jgi:glycosyltransferase involved in cell wall biosynthesis
MKILFCSPISLKEILGMARALLALSAEFKDLGWEVKMVSPDDFFEDYRLSSNCITSYTEALHTYLCRHAADYDVVEYDHVYLPFPRTEFASQTLFVARSQLLAHHFHDIKIPQEKHWRSRVSRFIRARSERRQQKEWLERARITMSESDLVVVLNQVDKDSLTRDQIDPAKIYVIPNGLSPLERQRFDAVDFEAKRPPLVGFLGSFFPRKGSADFPMILQHIMAEVPEVSFRLLGTSRSVRRTYALFPQRLRHRIGIYPEFAPEDLPGLLAPCSVGIFPSYIEGFGLAVLEMLAASIPVIAYDAPGPPVMLDPEYLVPPGDAAGMAQKVVDLLQNPDRLSQARIWAKERSKQFCWRQIAQQTSEIYIEHWRRKQVA